MWRTVDQGKYRKLGFSQASLTVREQGLALGSSTSVVFEYESDKIGYSAAGGRLVLRGRSEAVRGDCSSSGTR